METVTHCAYNLTRNVTLSERVVIVSDLQAPAQLLATVLNGPGRDPNSAVWLTHPDDAADMSRIFAFNVAYLDSQQQILAVAAVGPGTPFPLLTGDVASILFLPDQSLARSGTMSGDTIKICTESELSVLLSAASPSPMEAQVQENDPFAHELRPHQAEPFLASLIYLPSFGSSQSSEFFLPEAPAATVPSGPVEEEAPEAIQYDWADSEPAAEPEPIELQSQPEPVVKPPLPPILIPQSLRSVIQRIDEQIRREGRLHRVEDEIEKRLEESRTPRTSPPQDLDQIATGRAQPTTGAAPPEPPEARPDFEIENISEFPESAEIAEDDSDSLPQAQVVSGHVYLQPSDTISKVEPPITEAPQPSPELKSPVHDAEAEVDLAAIHAAKEKLSFSTRVQRWLAGESISLSGNRRRGERISAPGLFAFYWTGGAPTPQPILNISISGLYLRSKDLWSPDTLVRMTLERQNDEIEESESISVLTRVVRSDEGGVAHEFVMTEVLERLRVRDLLPEHGTNRKELEKFLAPY
jgi:hypothetical protein